MSEQRLEDALRDALRREEPPVNFAAKILARTVGAPALQVAPKRTRIWQRPAGLAVAAAIAAMAIVPAVMVEQHRREQERGLKAKQDILTALRITREQFQQAKERVARATGQRAGEQQ
jgi:hypothetical protein